MDSIGTLCMSCRCGLFVSAEYMVLMLARMPASKAREQPRGARGTCSAPGRPGPCGAPAAVQVAVAGGRADAARQAAQLHRRAQRDGHGHPHRLIRRVHLRAGRQGWYDGTFRTRVRVRVNDTVRRSQE